MPATPLSGVLIPAVSTFAASGELDLRSFAANLTSALSFGMNGALIAGSSGEAALLDDAERQTLIRCAREAIPRDKWLLAGVGAESTRQTIARAITAAAEGADAVLVVAPHYYLKRIDHAALSAHYNAVADASPIPVMMYNIPVFAHIVLSPALVHELAQHENIIGMKDSAGNLPMLAEYLTASSDTFRVMTGSGGTVVPALKAGAAGAILSIALFAGPPVLAMYDAYRAGDELTASALQLRLAPLAAELAGALGPAGIKAAMDLVGLAGGPPRSPLQPLTPDENAFLHARLESAGLLPA